MNRFRFARVLVLLALTGSLAADDKAPAEKPVTTFTGHKAAVTALAFSPDGQQVLSASASDAIVWDRATGKEIRTLPVGGRVVAFAPDGKSLAIADREKVTVHDAADGKALVTFDPNGKWDGRFPFRP